MLGRQALLLNGFVMGRMSKYAEVYVQLLLTVCYGRWGRQKSLSCPRQRLDICRAHKEALSTSNHSRRASRKSTQDSKAVVIPQQKEDPTQSGKKMLQQKVPKYPGSLSQAHFGAI